MQNMDVQILEKVVHHHLQIQQDLLLHLGNYHLQCLHHLLHQHYLDYHQKEIHLRCHID